jgi:hypothetical protein
MAIDGHYPKKNILKGAELEAAVHEVYKQSGYDVENHEVTDGGVDSKAFKNGKLRVAQCWNWPCGGYPNPLRWLSTIDELQDYPSADMDLICVGVHPTIDQYEDAHNHLSINIIYGDTVAEATTKLKNLIRGVTTLPENETAKPEYEEPASISYPFSSYAELELSFWNELALDIS